MWIWLYDYYISTESYFDSYIVISPIFHQYIPNKYPHEMLNPAFSWCMVNPSLFDVKTD